MHDDILDSEELINKKVFNLDELSLVDISLLLGAVMIMHKSPGISKEGAQWAEQMSRRLNEILVNSVYRLV